MEYGDPNGTPMLGFHGTPGSRFMLRLADGAASELGIRLIAPERPGFGLSTFQKGRTLAGWARDVEAFTQALGVERFAVAGVSGGGPYAAACAAMLPHRVTAAGFVSPIGPLAGPEKPDRVGWGHYCLFRLFPRIPGVMAGIFTVGRLFFLYAPQVVFGLILGRSAPADWKILSRGDVRRNLIAGVAEGFRPGVRGGVEEMRVFSMPWDVPLAAITAPCFLWQGLADRNVPVSAALRLGEFIPHCQVFKIDGAGHYWVFDNIRLVLATLVDATKSTTGA
jgi:pimeloyl-ACP methyl ester carboxylesterase